MMMYEKPQRDAGFAALICGIHSQIASRSHFGSTGLCMARNSSLLPESSERRTQSCSSMWRAAASSRSPRLPLVTTATCSFSSFRYATKSAKPGYKVGSPPPIRITERRPALGHLRHRGAQLASSCLCLVLRMSQSMQWSQR